MALGALRLRGMNCFAKFIDQRPERCTVSRIKMRETRLNVGEDLLGIIERGPRELYIAIVKFFERIVHQAKSNVNVSFDQLDANAVGCAVVWLVRHREWRATYCIAI
jgi:hypothetical protein